MQNVKLSKRQRVKNLYLGIESKSNTMTSFQAEIQKQYEVRLAKFLKHKSKKETHVEK